MKKFKNIVIGGISTKVFNLILLTVILLTAAFVVVSLYHNGMLAKLTEESSARQQKAIKVSSKATMHEVIDRSMSQSTSEQAQIADEMFKNLKIRVEMLGTYAEKLFSDPDKYQRREYSAPDLAQDGKVTTQFMTAEGVDTEDPDIVDSVGLAANMQELMASLYSSSEDTNSCFIALPNGTVLITDDRSAAKFDDNGNLLNIDPRTRPWYKQAVEQGKLIFTDVEKDAFTGVVGIVCAMPVYADGELVAVVGSDLFLTSMNNNIQNLKGNGTYVCVVNQNGHVVFSPKTDGYFQVVPADEAQDLRTVQNNGLALLVMDSLNEVTNVRSISFDGGDYYVCGAPMPTAGWALISVCDKEILNAPAVAMQEEYESIQNDTREEYNTKTSSSQLTALILILVVAAAMLAVALWLAKRIVRPLNKITNKIANLSGENLEFKMEDSYKTGDEIEELARSFSDLSHKTVVYLDEVKRVTAEKERIGAELSLATEIQAAMLPHIFPAFPDRKEFDLFASMDPAKEVGGDFYDYFLVDEDHLCMVIADVSGKGVPAALFMMASKIILQSFAMFGSSAKEILEKTNNALCSNNEAEMFVTVWLGILELSTGKLTAANAGHEYPIIKNKDGNFELYKDKHGFVLGGMEGAPYSSYDMQLEPGTKIFVYTDGVPEATNAEQELFGTDRLVEVLNENKDAAPKDILVGVRKAVDGFVKEAEQFDDLTMLCIEYKG